MSNRFLVVVVALLVIIGGFFVYSKNKSSNNQPANTTKPTNHVKGDGTKNVTLIEYGDYQCPACGSYEPVVRQVFEAHKADIVFQFRNFPLTSIHPNAFVGARAAEAAALQNKFWEMHDKLYEENLNYYAAQNQGQVYNTWINASNPSSYFEQYAQQLGLDVNKFKQDIQSQQVNDLINADLKAGKDIGANSTPTFVLDGKKIENPRSLEEFNKVIDDAIAAKSKS